MTRTTVASVCPWIVQMGFPAQRAGWYTPFVLDRLTFGIRARSADELPPQLQHLEVGDLVNVLGMLHGITGRTERPPIAADETARVSTRASTAEAMATNESLHTVVGVRSVREDVLRGLGARPREDEAPGAGVFDRALLQKSG